MNKQNTQQDSRLQEAWLEDCTDFRHAQTCQGLKQQMICFLYDKSPHILADIKLRDNSSCLIQIIERQKYQKYFTCAPFTFQRQSRTIQFTPINSHLSLSLFFSISSSISPSKVQKRKYSYIRYQNNSCLSSLHFLLWV